MRNAALPLLLAILTSLLVCAPGVARSQDTLLFVPNQRIGDIRPWETRAAVEYTYGAGRSHWYRWPYSGATYTVNGRKLNVQYNRERVVLVGTASPYYRTVANIGVGTRIPFGKNWRGFTHQYWWLDGHVWLSHKKRVQTVLATTRGVVAYISVGIPDLQQPE